MCLLELLESHRVLALVGLVLRESLEVSGEAQKRRTVNEPLRGVKLIPLDGVAVVDRELMVVVVIALAKGKQRSDNVVAGRVLVIEGRLSEPVRERVDAECGL